MQRFQGPCGRQRQGAPLDAFGFPIPEKAIHGRFNERPVCPVSSGKTAAGLEKLIGGQPAGWQEQLVEALPQTVDRSCRGLVSSTAA